MISISRFGGIREPNNLKSCFLFAIKKLVKFFKSILFENRQNQKAGRNQRHTLNEKKKFKREKADACFSLHIALHVKKILKH